MSLFPLEKIATDRLDARVLVKLGFRPFFGQLPGMVLMGGLAGLGHLGAGAARMAGHGVLGSAKLFGRTAQMIGDAVVKYPRAAAGVGAPAVFGIKNLPERLEAAQNNIYPENPYMY